MVRCCWGGGCCFERPDAVPFTSTQRQVIHQRQLIRSEVLAVLSFTRSFGEFLLADSQSSIAQLVYPAYMKKSTTYISI